MKTIDLHADTLMKLYFNGGELKENSYHIDIEKLKTGNSFIQTFAIFTLEQMINNEKYPCPAKDLDELVKSYQKIFVNEIEKNSEQLQCVKSNADIDELMSNDKVGALLSLEGAAMFYGDINKVQEYYDLGMRMMSLTWNDVNTCAYPNVPEENMSKGLTDFGRECIKKMDELGIIIDVSHLSDQGFWDIYELTANPFIASHSNARTLGPHVRNLTDDMIKALAERGGVMGMNFCTAFLSEDTDREDMKVQDIVNHINYIKNLVGIDYVALGTDFDGIGGNLEIADFSEMNKLWSALEKEGYSTEEIEKVAYKNALRVFRQVLK